MKTVRQLIHMITKNIKTLILFELLYKALALFVFTPLITGFIQLSLKLRGFHYLSFENLKRFLLHPISICMIFFIILLATLYSVLDITAIIYILDASCQEKTITLKECLSLAIPNMRRLFVPENAGLILVIFFLVPFFNIGVASSYLSTMHIPEFIMKFIDSHWYLIAFMILVTLIVAFYIIRWLYAFHYFTLENCSFREARRKSIQLNPGRKWMDFLFLVLLQFLYFIIFLALGMLLILLIMLLSKVFAAYSIIHSVTSSIIWFALILQIACFVALTTPISYACISMLFYYHKKQCQEKVIHCSLSNSSQRIKPKRRLLLNTPIKRMVLTAGIIIGALCIFQLQISDANPDIEYLKTTEVTAHRGASVSYPENTMSAFVGARLQHADWIELDVQETKDGEIIVMHDSNLKRICNVDKNIWDTTYDELTYLDAGVWFSNDYAGEPIPRLEDVIKYAQVNNIQLNIELKPTGHEADFEEKVVALIKKHHFENRCVITSQQYQVLERVKSIDTAITTAYVMSFAYGDITQLKYADAYSVEATSITKEMVDRVHNQGKQIYAWTVNTQSTIRSMIQLNVDNIITDDVVLARECIYDNKRSNMLRDYMDFISNWLPTTAVHK